jgi:hypothetical protein
MTFLFRSLSSAFTIAGALVLALLLGDIFFEDPRYRIPPIVHALSGALIFTFALVLRAICKFTAVEMLSGLGFVILVVPGIVCASIESVQQFWWSYVMLMSWVIPVVTVPFVLALLLGSVRGKN